MISNPARLITASLLGAGLLLGGCTSSRTTADVTRFHLNQPVARGSVFVEPADPSRTATLEYRSYADAVSRALVGTGFTTAPSLAQAELVGVVDYGQMTRESLSNGSGLSIGLGGGSFGRGGGIGGGVSFPVGRNRRGNEVAVNMLGLQLKRRSDNSVIWEGRAVAEARGGTENAELSTAIPKLADALLTGFPGPSGRTVEVDLR